MVSLKNPKNKKGEIMNEKIMIKGTYGTMYEDVETVTEEVTNQFGEEYQVSAPNLMILEITSKDEPKRGDVIMTSSSEFELDALEYDYCNLKRDYFESTVIAKLLDFDGTHYVPEKSRNGGRYLHIFWEILEVKSSTHIE